MKYSTSTPYRDKMNYMLVTILILKNSGSKEFNIEMNTEKFKYQERRMLIPLDIKNYRSREDEICRYLKFSVLLRFN